MASQPQHLLSCHASNLAFVVSVKSSDFTLWENGDPWLGRSLRFLALATELEVRAKVGLLLGGRDFLALASELEVRQRALGLLLGGCGFLALADELEVGARGGLLSGGSSGSMMGKGKGKS